MKYFTTAIDGYFASWVLRDTWHTNHQLDTARFYRFIIAIDHFSKPIKRKLDPSDLRLTENPAELRDHFANVLAGHDRDPRTCNKKELKEKILLAVKRNHQNFDEMDAVELIEKYVARAMIILDALWAVKTIGFPNSDVQKWKPPLK